MVYFIINQNKGVLIGQHENYVYFSDVDTVGMATAITFGEREIAESLCVRLNKLFNGKIQVEVAVAESDSVINKKYCKKQGLKWV